MKKKLIPIISILLIISLLAGCDTTKVSKTKEITDKLTQTSVVLESNITEQKDFIGFFEDFKPSFLVPGLFEGVIPQGMCYDETTDTLLITGYYEEKKFPSVIMKIDAENGEFLGYYPLQYGDGANCFSHVGGVATSENTVFITSESHCYTFALDLLENTQSGNKIKFQNEYPIATGGAFACINDGVLWIGDFTQSDDEDRESVEDPYTVGDETFYAFCEGYVLDDGNSDFETVDYYLAIPEQVQGMTFTSDGKIIFSTSYGRKNNSKLHIYNNVLEGDSIATRKIKDKDTPLYAFTKDSFVETIVAPPMAEGIVNTPKGVYIVFESGAAKYRNGGGKFPVDTLYLADM